MRTTLSPPRARRSGEAGVARLLFGALQRRRFPGWRRRLARFRRTARLDAVAFRAWQGRRVRAHLAWARRAVPFWRAHVREGTRLEDLPILTRGRLQRNVEALRDHSRPEGRLEPDASGGSTGEPVRLWHDRAYQAAMVAAEVFVLERWGVPPWCRMAFLWGADRDLRTVSPREHLLLTLLQKRLFDAFRLGPEDLDRVADALARFQPEYVVGYASALDLLSAHLIERGRVGEVRPRLVRSSAEMLRPEARARIEAALGAPVSDFYGSRESAALAAECPAGRRHVLATEKVIELVDAAGRPVPPGTPGQVLVTDLANRAFGLIRYATGDAATWADPAPCPCGLPFPSLERILGRTSDFVTRPDGERIHGEWFTHLFYGRDDVRRFQVRQPALDRVEVLTVGPADAEALADLLARARERLGPDVTVTWRAVDDIPPTATGKHRFTVSDVPWLPETR